VPAPVYFRFANGYVYATARDKELLDKGNLIAPDKVLPSDQGGAVSVTANIDRIPANLKELALGTLENRLADAKEQELPHQTEAQKTLQAAELDTALDMQGPGPEGLYTLVGGIKIKDKEQLETSVRKMADRFPKVIKLDAAKSGSVSIHRINPHKNQDPVARRALGENPMYLAIRDDVLLIGAGEKSLDAVKEALAIAPTTGKVLELQVALSRMTPLFDDPSHAELARKVFGADKDSDRLRLTVEGGQALTMRLSLKAKLIQYINERDKASKKNAE
jgi:hypothetical protein